MPVTKKDKKGGNNPCIVIFGFILISMLTFLLGGCDGVEDPCTQHTGINGSEPFYYYTGDCGEGVTEASTKQPTVPYSIHFDNSFLNYNAGKPKDFIGGEK